MGSLIQCQACPRLRRHCQKIARIKRKAYLNDTYWGKPVPPFGDPQAKLLVVGLAPGAHGANRTGRVFTGDRSGDWLYRGLYRAGFANQAESTSKGDGLVLQNARVTCAVKCAPPDNKPTTSEVARCRDLYLSEELTHHPEVKVYLALGRLAWEEIQRVLLPETKRQAFKHGAEISLGGDRTLIASFHPSQQNTFTRRLTEPMFDQIFARCQALVTGSARKSRESVF